MTFTLTIRTAEDIAADALAEARADAVLDRFTFAERVAQMGLITYAEAAGWAAGNVVPAAVQALIDGMPEADRGPVILDVLARPIIRRDGDLMPALAAAFQTDEAGLDVLFGIGV
jgi:hypothetical protein